MTALDVTETTEHEHRWTERPILSGLVGAVSFLLPVVVSVVAAIVVSRVLPRPDGVVETLAWWATLTAVTVMALMLVERLTRRLLPLAALLRMSMLFPDRAPSRFKVAFRAGTTRQLERRVHEARTTGMRDEPAKAAETILTLAAALSAHDRRTRGHSERVRAFTDLLATEMKLEPEDCDRLRWAALLHDVGKLGISPAILNKEGEPDEDEWAVIHRHPQEGARLVAPLQPWLGGWAASVEHHHEKWDGTGYPFGLSGEEISLGARIVAVADSYEVMTAVRSYKKSLSAADARRELAKCAGSHFDPAVVRAFLNVSLGRLRWAMGPIAWLVELPFVGGLPRALVAPLTQGGTASTGLAAATLALGTLGVAGLMTAEAPTPATANEKRPTPTSQMAGIDVERGAGLDRLVVNHPTTAAGDDSAGAPSRQATGTSSSPRSGEVTTGPAPAPAATPATPDEERVAGTSYERPPTTQPASSTPSSGATRSTVTPSTLVSPTTTRATTSTTRRTTTTTADDPECEAGDRGLERGAAEEHPFCDFEGERETRPSASTTRR